REQHVTPGHRLGDRLDEIHAKSNGVHIHEHPVRAEPAAEPVIQPARLTSGLLPPVADKNATTARTRIHHRHPLHRSPATRPRHPPAPNPANEQADTRHPIPGPPTTTGTNPRLTRAPGQATQPQDNAPPGRGYATGRRDIS